MNNHDRLNTQQHTTLLSSNVVTVKKNRNNKTRGPFQLVTAYKRTKRNETKDLL